MKKFFSSLIFSLIMLFSFVGNAYATNFTLSSASQVTQDGITVSFAKGSGSTAPTWYAAGLRLYASNTITITSTNTITGIVFNWEKQGNKAFASATASTGSYTHPSNTGTGTWTGSATSVTFTLGSSGQLQLNTFSVTTSGGGSTTYTVTYNANGGAGNITDSNSPYNSGATVTVLSNNFTAPTGKEFDKWNTNSTGTATSYNPGETFTISSNVTLYAIWKDLPMDCDGTLYDFTSISGFSGWKNSYAAHTVEYTNDSIIFNGASKQAGTITNMPVNKNADILVKARNGEYIVSCDLRCKQWGTKTQTISLSYSTDGGSTFTSTGITSNTFAIAYDNFPSNVNVIKFGFNYADNQIGIDKLCIVHGSVTPTAVDTVTLPVDTIRIHIGETYELTPTIIPLNATNKNVTWVSTMPAIATVDNGIVTGVAEGITGVMVITEDGNKHAQCVVIVLGTPNIDVVEWNPDWLKIDIDNFTAATATLEDQNTQAEVKENIATELFFSKYFEAQGAIKLLGIYNGTKDSINLTDYKVKVAQGDKSTSWNKTFELGTLGYIHSNEEIILISYTKNDSSITKCILEKNPQGLNYQRVASGELIGGELQFNGDDAVGLFKNTSLIDIIGAGTSSSANVSNLTSTNASGSNPKTMYGHTIDMDCWITNNADGSNGNDTTIATNLCLLIRKNTVHSGDTAVKYNTTDFITLSTEWIGKQVQKDTLSTCNNFDYVGTYDYTEHYVGFDTIYTDISIPGKADDGFYKIDIPELDTLSCTNLKISVKDVSNNTLEKVVKIPIMIKTNATTTDTIYFDKKECNECDVVVLKNKKLTVVGTASANRDVKLYSGAHLSVPTGTEYTINSLSLRRENDTVSTLGLVGTLAATKLYFDLFIDYTKWYWVSIPDVYTLSNVKFTNGKTPIYERDYWVRWYDGKHRAETQSGSWKGAPEDTTFQAGAGFIIGLADELNKKEFRFELNASRTLTNELSNKSVNDLHAWGCNNEELRPNHKGWNMIGNPFLNNIETDLAEPIRIDSLVKVMENGKWTGQWELSNTTRGKQFRYAVIPSKAPEDRDAGGYKSVVLDDITLAPFGCFFVQIGGENPNTSQAIVFNTTSRNKYNAAPRRFSEQERDEELFLRVKVDNWKTGCFISNQFTDKYEPGDDLESRYPIYQNIGGYKLLYSAINDSIIEHGVNITAPSGTLYLDQKVDVDKFEYIYAIYNNTWYNLKNGDTVDLNGDFILQAKRKVNNDVPTNIDNVQPTSGIYKFSDGKNIYINKNGTIFSIIGGVIK